jgi:hypothetical protein
MISDKEEEARKEEREAIRKKIASAAAYPVIDLEHTYEPEVNTGKDK